VKQSLLEITHLNIPMIGKVPLYIIILVFVFTIAVLQDYLFSRIQGTGFYLSEALLYNMFWAFFVPFSFISSLLFKIVYPKNRFQKLLLALGIGIVISLFHILIFSSVFVFISHIVYKPSHRFFGIFNTAISNQFYITFLFYTLFPIFYFQFFSIKNNKQEFSGKLKIKIGSKTKLVDAKSIQLITKDKPFCAIHVNKQRFLVDRSLKSFENELSSDIFLRVHRSTIVNATFIKELKSRQNGDYDGLLENGNSVRFSRHFRNNWQQLLQ